MGSKQLPRRSLQDITRLTEKIKQGWNLLIDSGVDPVGLHRLIMARKKSNTGRPARALDVASLAFAIGLYHDDHPGATDTQAIREVLRSVAIRKKEGDPAINMAGDPSINVEKFVADELGRHKTAWTRYKRALQR